VSQISNYPRIDPKREAELSEIILDSKDANAIEEAVNELVLANLRLVLHCLKDYNSFLSSSEVCISLMDLVSEGNIALMAAARGFDATFSREDGPRTQAKFGTYACRCIRSRMQRAIKLSRLVHIPERHFTYRKKLEEIESEAGQNLTDEQISAKIGIRKERLDMVRWSSSCKTTRLEDMKTDEDSSYGIDDLPDSGQTLPDEEAAKNDLMDLVMEKMNLLKPRTKLMLEQMFLSGMKVTLQDLSNQFGVSKERCRQITQAGLKKLRDMIRSEVAGTAPKTAGKRTKKWPPDLSVRVGQITENWSTRVASLSEVA
jgi:RNA polymerase sigma-32 factor